MKHESAGFPNGDFVMNASRKAAVKWGDCFSKPLVSRTISNPVIHIDTEAVTRVLATNFNFLVPDPSRFSTSWVNCVRKAV
jgi:hypothetical protein